MSAWPWPSSESTAKIIPAFVKALQAADDVTRNKKANIETKTGGKVNYAYADLEATLDAVKPILTANDLAAAQTPTAEGVHTILMHTSGEWLAFPPLEVRSTQQTPQGQGSAITYARRYQILSILNIATEDDDGKAASKPAPPAAPPQQRNKRVDDALAGMAALDEAGKKSLKSWAGTRKLSGAALLADSELLTEVENWLAYHEHEQEAAA